MPMLADEIEPGVWTERVYEMELVGDMYIEESEAATIRVGSQPAERLVRGCGKFIVPIFDEAPDKGPSSKPEFMPPPNGFNAWFDHYREGIERQIYQDMLLTPQHLRRYL
jgi:hypothetical protein